MDLALLLLGLVWGFFGGKDLSRRETPPPRPTSSPPARPPRVLPPPRAPSAPPRLPVPAAMPGKPPPAPWPQVVPAGLPPFPGPGWEPDEPPPLVVQQRAGQLLSQLWSRGAGTFKIEQTAGRWIAYRAAPHGPKKGVVAYRVRKAPGTGVAPSVPRPPSSAPSSVPEQGPIHVHIGPATIEPDPVVSPVSPIELPTLRYGMGLRPREPNADVKLLQQKLGISSDGRFGQETIEAVKEFQWRRQLDSDGVVGPKTWAALFREA